MTSAKAIETMDRATDLWEDVDAAEVCQEDINRVEEMLDLSAEAFDREDWTGAWMWAGNAIGYIRERIRDCQPVTA